MSTESGVDEGWHPNTRRFAILLAQQTMPDVSESSPISTDAGFGSAMLNVPSGSGSPRSGQYGSDQYGPGRRGLELACLAAKVADDYRGSETVVLDLRGVTPMFDFFVISSGTSNRQMRSLAEEVNRMMKQHGSRSPGMEGDVGSPWLLYDYGDIVIHVLSPEARKLYNLEELWADAERVDWKAVMAAQTEESPAPVAETN